MSDPVIDISHWQNRVDLEEVKRSGVVGVIHKATEGHTNVDDRYAERRKGADEVGLLWGAYHFLRPGDMSEQAKHFVDVAGDVDIYAADHEDPKVSLTQLKLFLKEVQMLTGKEQLVVYSGHVIKEQLSGRDAELAKHRLWLAHYTTAARPEWERLTWPKWWLWQYTDQGTCPGIGGSKVDLNRYEGSTDQLVEEWTGAEPEVEPPQAERTVITITIDGPATVNVVKE